MWLTISMKDRRSSLTPPTTPSTTEDCNALVGRSSQLSLRDMVDIKSLCFLLRYRTVALLTAHISTSVHSSRAQNPAEVVDKAAGSNEKYRKSMQ